MPFNIQADEDFVAVGAAENVFASDHILSLSFLLQ
jgi:hypothetical protein